jgi:DNA polymerase elongation subunit (family B)
VRVYKFPNETAMMLEFQRAIIGLDPDIIDGYFSNVFDANYLDKRARQLKLYKWRDLGRMPSLEGHSALYITRPRVTRGTTKVDVYIGGRIVLDMWRWVTAPGPNKGFTDTHLNAISLEITKKTKVDMPPDRIAHAYMLNDATLGRLVWYASMDTQLLYELDKIRQIIPEYLEQARCRCIPPQHVHDRGTEHSVQAALLYYMHETFLASETRDRRLLVPTKRRDRPFVVEDKFEGGMVRKPKSGYYEERPASR